MRSYLIGLAAASLLPSLSLSLSPGISPNPSFLSKLHARKLYAREVDSDELFDQCLGYTGGNDDVDKDSPCYEFGDAASQCAWGISGDTEFTETPDDRPPKEEQKCICDERRDPFWVGMQRCFECMKEHEVPEGMWIGPEYMSSMSDAYCTGTPTQAFSIFSGSFMSTILETVATATSGWTEGTAEPMSSQGLAASMPTGIDRGLVGAAGVVVAALVL